MLSVSEETQQCEVQAGTTRIRLGLENVEKVTQPHGSTSPKFIPVSRQLKVPVVSAELDLRGKRAEEVEWLLDSYLNDACLANLTELCIIHGFGTGTVRSIVREYLASYPLVKSFRPGEKGEGGDGVTMVQL